MFRAITFLIKLPFVIVISLLLAIWQTFVLPFTVAKEENERAKSTGNAPTFFRTLRDPFGNKAIDHIEKLSDNDISSVFEHMSRQLEMIALQKNWKLKDSLINGVVRDCLMIHAANGFDQGFAYQKQVLDTYAAHGEAAIKVKGQHYG
jgi:hypothetical protein